MQSDGADAYVRTFCLDSKTALIGPYSPIGGPGAPLNGEELLAGRYFHYRVIDADRQTVDLHAFFGLSQLGGLLWERHLRALIKVSAFGSPAIARTRAGRYVNQETAAQAGFEGDAAFVATDGSDYSMDHPDALRMLRADPLEAARHFTLLAHALGSLHDIGIAHRNLWPGALDVVDDAQADGQPRLRLRMARFEMSALVSDLLAGRTNTSDRDSVRRLYLSQSTDSLRYCPPERLGFLLDGESKTPQSESPSADVYSLGAIAWDWFYGPVPAEMAPQPLSASPTSEELSAARQSLADIHEFRLDTVRKDGSTIRELRDLLAQMLADIKHDRRPLAAEVANALVERQQAFSIAWGPEPASSPYLLLYMPKESKPMLHQWGFLEHDPETPEGSRELAEFIRTDLHHGELCQSTGGATDFTTQGTDETRRDATRVLIGDRIVWFCDLFRMKSPFGGLEEKRDEALLIKFSARKDIPEVQRLLETLRDSVRARPAPEVELVPSTTSRGELDHMIRGRPSWRTLYDSVRPLIVQSPQEKAQIDAISWLIEYQAVELSARQYPYRCDVSGVGDQYLIHWDRERDEQRIHRSTMFTLYNRRREDFGDFFDKLGEVAGEAVELWGRTGGPKSGSVIKARVLRREGPDRIVVKLRGGRQRIPASGWIAPLDDMGSRIARNRQLDARAELLRLPGLLNHLRKPSSIEFLPERWADAGEGLLGNASEVVTKILSCQPISAVQGPPGTGKTTVVARAIAASMRAQDSERILVSAQSNFALDNLAVRVLREIGAMNPNLHPDDAGAPIAVRVRAKLAEIDESVQPWTREQLVVRRARQAREHVADVIARKGKELAPELRRVLKRWESMLAPDGDSVEPELSDRLQRAANIVFVTCNTATPELISPGATATLFDWIIIEEAAKAWPTELFLPMVRGLRWTLVGDHKQLGAHRREEMLRFLDEWYRDSAETGIPKAQILQTVDLFRHLFEKDGGPPVLGTTPATFTLSTQFRMRKEIAQVASRVFYPPTQTSPRLPDGLLPEGLKTIHNEKPAEVTEPSWLRGRPLVWLDTHDLPDCRDQPRWSNPGEAELVRRLLERLRPRPQASRNRAAESELAVLTPYRDQADLLIQSSDVAPFVQTVHAFQGKEAEIVVVSLVRSPRPQGGERLNSWQGYGHLASPELVNVMTSRARRLHVMIGDFAHFQKYSDADRDFWRDVCRVFEVSGRVLPAAVLSQDWRPE